MSNINTKAKLLRWLSKNHPQFVYKNVSKNDVPEMAYVNRFVPHHVIKAVALTQTDFDDLQRSLECMTYDSGHIERLMMETYTARETYKNDVIQKISNNNADYNTVDSTQKIVAATRFIKDCQNYFYRNEIAQLTLDLFSGNHPDILEHIIANDDNMDDDAFFGFTKDDMHELVLGLDHGDRSVYINLTKKRKEAK